MQISKVIIIKNGQKLEPFNDLARDLLILNKPLHQFQKDELSAVKNCSFIYSPETIRPDELKKTLDMLPDKSSALIFRDNLLFSHEFIQDFIKGIKDSGACSSHKVALKKTLYQKQFALLQNDCIDHDTFIDYFLFYFYKNSNSRPSSDSKDHALGQSPGQSSGKAINPAATIPTTIDLAKSIDKRVVIDAEQFYEAGNFPSHMLGKENFKYAITSKIVLSICEPIHIGLSNIAANCARLARYKKPGFMQACKALFHAFTAFSLKRETIVARVLRGFSHIHPKAKVHPTAVIEGSIIGKNAKIGAYAVVRFSVVDEDAFIDDHAGIKFSVIGKKAYIANNNVIFFTTVYPGAFLISGPYHFSCFGYNSAIMNSIPSDYRLDGKNIKVATSKGIEDTGLKFTGSIFGHNTRVAAGMIFAPGRAVPNNLTIYPDPARVITKMPPKNITDTTDTTYAPDITAPDLSDNCSGDSKVLFSINGSLIENPKKVKKNL